MTTVLLIIVERRPHGETIHVRSKISRTQPRMMMRKKKKKEEEEEEEGKKKKMMMMMKSSSKAERAFKATNKPYYLAWCLATSIVHFLTIITESSSVIQARIGLRTSVQHAAFVLIEFPRRNMLAQQRETMNFIVFLQYTFLLCRSRRATLLI